MSIDDRFETETIANNVNGALAQVEDGYRKHAAQPLDEAQPPMLICVEDELGIRARAKVETGLGQRLGVRSPVVDLAVVGYPDVPGSVGHGLIGLRARVDDREACREQ